MIDRLLAYLTNPMDQSSLSLWLTILLAGLITYAIRLSFIIFFGWREIPGWLRRALRFVPPAVLSAIIFPSLLMPNGQLDVSFGNDRLIAGSLAIVVAWRTRSALWTVLIGMIALWILQYFF